MIDKDVFENKSYFKNQIFPFNLNSRPNYCNNLMNYVNVEEEMVRKIDFDLKKGMKKNYSSIDLIIPSTISKDDDKEFYKIRRSIIVRIHLSREVLKKEKKNLKKK